MVAFGAVEPLSACRCEVSLQYGTWAQRQSAGRTAGGADGDLGVEDVLAAEHQRRSSGAAGLATRTTFCRRLGGLRLRSCGREFLRKTGRASGASPSIGVGSMLLLPRVWVKCLFGRNAKCRNPNALGQWTPGERRQPHWT